MLSHPTKGFARSVNKHNTELMAFCDWLEASLLFDDDDVISTTDCVDVLVDGQVYDDQDFAREQIANAWRELETRQRLMGKGSAYRVDGSRLYKLHKWIENPALSFVIALSAKQWYTEWANSFGPDHTDQGRLFELLTFQSLSKLFPDWGCHVTGWSRATAGKLEAVVHEVANKLGESIGDIGKWASPDGNEAGLDVVFYRPFRDGRGGTAVFLLQCASGRDWQSKLKTPDLKIWGKIIQFASSPQKAFAMPFAISNEDFIRTCNLIDGMLLDRFRLLMPGTDGDNWVSDELMNDLVQWLQPRVLKLLTNRL